MSSSVFSETASVRPNGADGDSNLVIVYGKNGISFDNGAIENIMEEKSIASISVVRITSPTPSMVDQEEKERLEELERFLEMASENEESEEEKNTDNESQSAGEELASEKDHVTGDDNENTGGENNDDSTETEAEAAPKIKKRPGRKPKPKKVKKRRKPKERPQIVGLTVEHFYTDSSADLFVKNALKLAGVSLFKRTAETDALMEIIRNDHNYTPFTCPEQLRAKKSAEKLVLERQAQHGRKFIVQTQANIKLVSAKKRIPVMPLSQVPQQQPPLQLPRQQVPRQIHQQQQQQKRSSPVIVTMPRPIRNNQIVKVLKVTDDMAVEDDEDAHSSVTADDDTEELSGPSDVSRETDNDRDSDIDFKMNNSRNSNKRKRIKKLPKRPPIHAPRATHTPAPPASNQSQAQTQPPIPSFKRRREPADNALASPQIGQIVQLNMKAPPSVIALGRGMQSTGFLKMRPSHKVLPKATPFAAVRRTPFARVEHVVSAPPVGFATPTPPQDVKEILINKNLSSPKGVFTNLNSLLADSPESIKQRLPITPSTPKTSLHQLPASSTSTATSASFSSKGFMPIGVETASSHKLPAQIIIETHQSSSELAAENDKQLDLIDSIVQDELLKTSLAVDQKVVSADENIPKLVKMLESSAAGLDQVPQAETIEVANAPTHTQNFAVHPNPTVDELELLETPDEDEITADFLQHVVGLIEEDKQFEAEVVKQVLESTESGSLDAQIFDTSSQLPIISQPNDFVINTGPGSLSNLPIACSTPARSLATMSVSSSTLPAPPEVKVVRGNGRVIYLPPIEAPTTRAKRRAQHVPPSSSTSATSDISIISNSESMQDVRILTNSHVDSDNSSSSTSRKHLPRESAGRRSTKMDMSVIDDAEVSESQEDDDDPNKLWCICRQPHNNRFMICCDLCEDWYHGTCVSVTKSMGLEMEQKGLDWKCPKCVKKQEEKTQPRITDMLLPRHNMDTTLPKQLHKSIGSPSTSPAIDVSRDKDSSLGPKQVKRLLIAKSQPKVLHQQQLHFMKVGGDSVQSTTDTACVVCKRPARPNSVYCSDECIRKHALSAIQAQTVAKTPEPLPPAQAPQFPVANAVEAKKNKKRDLFEDVLRQADTVSKVERINVFERRTGRALFGHLAPSAHQLKKWLQDNPSFEVVQPGSSQALEIEKRLGKRIPESSVPENAERKLPQKPAETLNRPMVQLLPNPQPSPLKRDKPIPKPTATQRHSPDKNNAVNKFQPEPIRLSVRRTLRDQLLDRIKEAQTTAPATDCLVYPSAADVDNFVKRVESEMYNSFGRDVGAKYKAKYRSLMFNIKDRKNRTLFEKICAKQVDPKQLVRMTPAELASQELAKWREEENRHQLDIIKKSELDLLACTQNYMVNTHKGEELVETKVNVTLPDEETVGESSKETRDGSDSKKSTQSAEALSMTDTSSKEVDLERSSERVKHHKSKDKSKDREKRHKSHSRSHHHSRKRSRSRSSSRGGSHKKHHHEHDGENERDKEQLLRDKLSTKERADKVQSPQHKKTRKESPIAFSLIDQILESEKTVEQAANLIQPTKEISKPETVPSATVSKPTSKPNLDNYGRYLQKLNSPSLWTGNLTMVDVTDFNVVIYPVLGNSSHLAKFLPINLDVIGRIGRDNVWDYLLKIKKSPTKEIVIVNLFPAATSDTLNFDSFFEYLDTRQRLGVLGADSDQIRDFYIFPLGTRDKLPSVLQTTDIVPFYEDALRPNTLLGIIVRCLSKTSVNMSQSLPLPLPTASKKTVKASSKARVRKNFTPPGSPKRKPSTHSTSSKDDEFDIDAIIKAPIAKLQKTEALLNTSTSLDDPDAPYSPGGSSDDNDGLTSSMPGIKTVDLERQVDEINKQIAAQRMEIAGLLNSEPTTHSQPSSSSNMLANISIPPNLTKILASLQGKSSLHANPTNDGDEEYNPEDAITDSSQNDMGSRHIERKSKGKSRLAQLSEAELLSMVPDDLVDMPKTTTVGQHKKPPPPGV